MLKIIFRKPSEISKGEWIDAVDMFGVVMAVLFFVSIIPCLVYKTSPDLPKISYSLFLLIGMDIAINKLLKKLWKMQKYRGMPHSKADIRYNKRFG